MISLTSEITDTKGSRAENGWVFFDRECEICTRLAHRFRGILAKRGFGLAALQDPRAASLLSIPPEEMLREIRVLTTDGSAVRRRECDFISRGTDLVGVADLFCRVATRLRQAVGRGLSLVCSASPLLQASSAR